MKFAGNAMLGVFTGLAAIVAVAGISAPAEAQEKRPNIVMLMSDDVGWGDYGVYFGGAALGIPRRTSIAWPRKARSSPVGTAKPVARRAAPPS